MVCTADAEPALVASMFDAEANVFVTSAKERFADAHAVCNDLALCTVTCIELQQRLVHMWTELDEVASYLYFQELLVITMGRAGCRGFDE